MPMRLGIALEGGGARCAAQAGALMALGEMGIVPMAYAGCGAGALVAALAACSMLKEKTVTDFGAAVRQSATLRNGVLNRRLRERFEGMLLRDAHGLALPTVDMESGAVQVLSSMLPVRPDPRPWSRQALVGAAVRYAMATPGVLPPMAWRGRRLCGGGQLRGTLPTLLRAMGAEHVLCIRVLDAGCAQHETRAAAQALCSHAMVVAPPPGVDMMVTIGNYEPGRGVLDQGTIAPLLEVGKIAAVKALPTLEALIGSRVGKIVLFPGMDARAQS